MAGWHVPLTQWTWVWASSRRLWRTGKCGVLQSMGSQRVRHDWVTEQQEYFFCRLQDSCSSLFCCLPPVSEVGPATFAIIPLIVGLPLLWWPETALNIDQGLPLCSVLATSPWATGSASYMFEYCYCCSVTKLCPTLWDPKNCSMPGCSVLHYLQEFAWTHVHWVDDAIQPSHPLLCPSPLALKLSQFPHLFQRVDSLHQVAKVLELQSFQRKLRNREVKDLAEACSTKNVKLVFSSRQFGSRMCILIH